MARPSFDSEAYLASLDRTTSRYYRQPASIDSPVVVRLGSIVGLLFGNGRMVIGGHDHVLFDRVLP